MCNSTAAVEKRVFELLPTGVLIDDQKERGYIGTVQAPPWVWHVFERK